jgi:hypothetical protein
MSRSPSPLSQSVCLHVRSCSRGRGRPGAVADSVHAASRTDCHDVFRTGDGYLVHYRNAYWRYHLAFADEALCTPEHIGRIFSRWSASPRLLQSLLEDFCLELRSESTENRGMSLLFVADDGGVTRCGVVFYMTTNYRPQNQILL